MAFLSFVRSRDNEYVYLTEYCGYKDHSTKKTVHIYPLGKKVEAVFTLQAWYLNYDNFPNELKQKGYKKEDIKKWIQYLKQKKKNIHPSMTNI
ncbi:MAG TPA: hypothetical protein GX497_03380 [Bacillus bacterium]|nr:hypothetical protein [Bacillus sp. (in: firmicutes)]